MINKNDSEMVKMMPYEEDFYSRMENSGRELVIYGAGSYAARMYPYLPPISYVCDKDADKIEDFYGIEILTLEQLEKKDGRYIILICIKNDNARKCVKEKLAKCKIDAEVFDLFSCKSFNVYKPIKREKSGRDLLRVRIVCYDTEGWILTKFAEKLCDNLELLGINTDIGKCVDMDADINHHIQFGYEPIAKSRDTIFISHVNSRNRFEQLKYELESAEMGICMSKDTMETLTTWGIPRHKLCYINPAHDGVIKPKKYVLGITHRCYETLDYRKRDNAILDICRAIDPHFFSFKIMGAGWNQIVDEMRKQGFEVEYYPEFDKALYNELIPSLDYYLYLGFDEGSMGYLDALAAGVKTIVTPQGFHLDAKNGISYSGRTLGDFADILGSLEKERRCLIESVADWTWENYAKKHVEVWNYILGKEDGIYQNQHMYEDGIFSVLRLNA